MTEFLTNFKTSFLILGMAEQARTYPTFPIPAVGAIAFSEGHVLLIQRGKPPAQGKWTLPGGVIEVGESPEEALIREIWEECQLKIRPVRVAEIVNKVIRDDTGKVWYHYLIIDYIVECVDSRSCRKFAGIPASDAANVRWVRLEELDLYDLTEGVADLIHKAAAIQLVKT